MRFPTADLVAACVLAISLAGGCANRGMVAPTDGGGTGGTALTGTGGHAGAGLGGAAGHAGGGGAGLGGAAGGRAGAGGAAGAAGRGGAGGQAGAGGAGGMGNRDAGCGMTDAHADHPSHCTATFSFESGAQGALLGVDQQAFTKLAVGSSNTACGSGALALTAAFSGTTGLTTKGEVDLPLGADGGAVSLSGKTLTIHSTATGTCGTDLKMTVVLVTSAGELFPLRNVPITSDWTTSIAVLSADAGSGIGSVVSLQIDVSSFTGYTGTVYLDEIDIR